MTAIELKDQGNRLFAMKKFDAAINCYTKAIIKSPNTPTFFTNRALCHLKLKQWEQAIQDCRQALDMDRSLVKGHFFMGQALVELGYYDESIASLKRAHDLAKEQKMNFGDDIASALRSAKKKRWNVLEEKRIQQEIALQTYLNKLINEEMVR
ncbi:STUB1 [Acanthosepion pharaonis]|uniref:RING-type E3 ubiquitin transferase n=1 Tax=Acanthosepion pharaonis TaxID=158019 RepID=A0A812AMQ4_ACAPH|nr:STUB1 [Sepia pharaonis]